MHQKALLPNETEKTSPSKKIQRRSHRLNFGNVSRRRGESNFVLAFERAYLREAQTSSRADMRYREVPVSGFGVADLVWISWKTDDGGHAVASEHAKAHLPHITAFEMKIKDWAGGLAQAARYRFFAHRSFLVIPEMQVALALKMRDTFVSAGVGLIAFDSTTGEFQVAIEGESGSPLSARAHKNAIERLRLK